MYTVLGKLFGGSVNSGSCGCFGNVRFQAMGCCHHLMSFGGKRGRYGRYLLLEHPRILKRGGFLVQEHSIGGNGGLGVFGNASSQTGLKVSENFLSTLELAFMLVSLHVDAGGALE